MDRRSFLAAGAAAIASVGPADAQTLLQIITIPIETGGEVYYAQDMHFFSDAGITAQIAGMTSGPPIAAAVLAGSAQIGLSNVVAIANARSRGLPFVFIAPAGEYRSAAPTTKLVVLPNSPIKTAADLNGKTIGVISLLGLDQAAVQAWIDQNGGNSATVRFIEITQPEIVPAMQRGTLDAAELAEPVLTSAASEIRVLAKSYDAIAKQFMIAGWFTTETWAKQNVPLVRKFADVIARAASWAEANPDAAATSLQANTKIRSLGNTRMSYARTLTIDLITPPVQVGIKYKLIPPNVSARELIARM